MSWLDDAEGMDTWRKKDETILTDFLKYYFYDFFVKKESPDYLERTYQRVMKSENLRGKIEQKLSVVENKIIDESLSLFLAKYKKDYLFKDGSKRFEAKSKATQLLERSNYWQAPNLRAWQEGLQKLSDRMREIEVSDETVESKVEQAEEAFGSLFRSPSFKFDARTGILKMPVRPWTDPDEPEEAISESSYEWVRQKLSPPLNGFGNHVDRHFTRRVLQYQTYCTMGRDSLSGCGGYRANPQGRASEIKPWVLLLFKLRYPQQFEEGVEHWEYSDHL